MDDQTPATKADIKALRDEFAALRDELLKHMDDWKKEIIQHFDVVVENIRHDLRGANRDAIEVLKDAKSDHEERITRLERHAGIVA